MSLLPSILRFRGAEHPVHPVERSEEPGLQGIGRVFGKFRKISCQLDHFREPQRADFDPLFFLCSVPARYAKQIDDAEHGSLVIGFA